MAEEIKSPGKKPPKRQGDGFLGCFGCGSRTTFKSKANVELNKKVVRGRGSRLYWSISKSTASTVPVEAAAAAIVNTVKYSERRLDRAISKSIADCPIPEATREKSQDDGQRPRGTESGRKKRAMTPLQPPPPPPTTPRPNRLDPIVVLSILMLPLTVLVCCGQLYAILCTAACFYVLPRLRPQLDREITNKAVVDSFQVVDDHFRSEERKKKVVLEGFLHRNNRNYTL